MIPLTIDHSATVIPARITLFSPTATPARLSLTIYVMFFPLFIGFRTQWRQSDYLYHFEVLHFSVFICLRPQWLQQESICHFKEYPFSCSFVVGYSYSNNVLFTLVRNICNLVHFFSAKVIPGKLNLPVSKMHFSISIFFGHSDPNKIIFTHLRNVLSPVYLFSATVTPAILSLPFSVLHFTLFICLRP